MTAALAEPYTRPRDFLARMTGLGRPVLWSLAATSFLGVTSAVAACAWAVHETRTVADQIRTFVVQVDAAGAVIGRFEAAAEWAPDAGAYIGFVQRWIRNERGRPTDQQTLIDQRREVIWATDQRVYGVLQNEMHQADVDYGRSAVDLADLSVNMIEQHESQAVLLARWTEHPRLSGDPPSAWTATVTVAHKPPKTTVAYGTNPLGMFVIAYQETRVQAPSGPSR